MPRDIIELRVHKDTTNENWLEKKSHGILHFCKQSMGLVVLIKYSCSIFIGYSQNYRFCRDLGKVLFFFEAVFDFFGAVFDFIVAVFVFLGPKLVELI